MNNKADLHPVRQNRSTSIFLNFFELFLNFLTHLTQNNFKNSKLQSNAYLLLIFELFISSVEGFAETRLIVS